MLKSFLVGKDSKGNELHVGDTCSFKVLSNGFDQFGKVTTAKYLELEGVISYDFTDFCFVFNLPFNFMPSLYMHVVEFDSVIKKEKSYEL